MGFAKLATLTGNRTLKGTSSYRMRIAGVGPRTGYSAGAYRVARPAVRGKAANLNQRVTYGAAYLGQWRYGAAGGALAIKELADVGPALMNDVLGYVVPWTSIVPWEEVEGWVRASGPLVLTGQGGWIRCSGGPTDACYAANPPNTQGVDGLTACLSYGSCPSNQILSSVGDMVVGGPVPAGARRMLLKKKTAWEVNGDYTVGRYTLSRQYRRAVGDNQSPYPPEWRAIMPQYRPLPEPWFDPLTVPRTSPDAVPGTRPDTRPRTKTDADGRLNARPSVRPALNIAFPGRGAPTVGRGNHVSAPDKESTRKSGPLGAASSGMRARFLRALALMRGATELKDAVDALFEGLPLWLQREMERKHGGDWIGHLLGIMDSADYYASNPATFTRAVNNLLWEGIEDRTIGNLLGSSWRDGIRDWDKYGSTAWTDASFDGAFSQ